MKPVSTFTKLPSSLDFEINDNETKDDESKVRVQEAILRASDVILPVMTKLKKTYPKIKQLILLVAPDEENETKDDLELSGEYGIKNASWEFRPFHVEILCYDETGKLLFDVEDYSDEMLLDVEDAMEKVTTDAFFDLEEILSFRDTVEWEF
jgi:hypothetical protein